jgi:hypothetical protein
MVQGSDSFAQACTSNCKTTTSSKFSVIIHRIIDVVALLCVSRLLIPPTGSSVKQSHLAFLHSVV